MKAMMKKMSSAWGTTLHRGTAWALSLPHSILLESNALGELPIGRWSAESPKFRRRLHEFDGNLSQTSAVGTQIGHSGFTLVPILGIHHDQFLTESDFRGQHEKRTMRADGDREGLLAKRGAIDGAAANHHRNIE
jgi:hypothetical protein